MQFFVNPKNVTRLYPWGEGENKQYWIDVANHLSAKEDKDVQAAGIPHVMQKPGDPNETPESRREREVKMGLDMGRMSIVRAAKYIKAWSITGLDGSPVPLSEAAIGELLPAVFEAIDKALDKHKTAMEAAVADPPQDGTASLKSA